MWEVRATTEARKVKAAATLWGTARVNAVDLLEHVLNGTLPAVTDKHPDGTTTRNEAETALAADKARAIAERFTEWAWEHPGRATRLGRLYNDKHNSLVARRFDGSHLSFPGMTATFTPWPWQADMTWMAACRPVALCGHPTGAGKTATACMIALTMRRLGLARKPAYIVPSHLIGQHAAEARRLYPGARILAASQHDLTPVRRRGFAARCAAGDWDLILMTHDQFEALPVGPGTEAAHLANITAAIDDAMCAAAGKGRAVKQLARRRRVIIARHEELLASGRDTGGVTFEQTRIDYLLYDEAHYAKNLDTITRADGFSSKGSKRATDLLLKLGHLTATSPSGRGGVLFTATFISNSLAELHTLLRFTCPDRLASLSLESFDAFTAAHIQYKTAVEVAPDGSGFRVYRRPWQYCNLAALREMLRDIADIRTKASIQLPGPIVETEHVPVHAAGIRDHSATLVARADAIRRGGVDPATDNMLAICTDGRRAALDPRLAGLPASRPARLRRSPPAPPPPTISCNTPPTPAAASRVRCRCCSAIRAPPATRATRRTGGSATPSPPPGCPPRKSRSSTMPPPALKCGTCSPAAATAASRSSSAPPPNAAPAPTSSRAWPPSTTWTPPGGPPTWNSATAAATGPATTTTPCTCTGTSPSGHSTPTCGRRCTASSAGLSSCSPATPTRSTPTCPTASPSSPTASSPPSPPGSRSCGNYTR